MLNLLLVSCLSLCELIWMHLLIYAFVGDCCAFFHLGSDWTSWKPLKNWMVTIEWITWQHTYGGFHSHAGIPSSLDGLFPWENPSIHGWELGVPPWIGNLHIRHTMQIATHYTTSMRWQISSYSWNSPLSDTTRRGALGQGKIDGDGQLEKTSISQSIFRMATRWYKNRWRPLQIVHRTGPAWDGSGTAEPKEIHEANTNFDLRHKKMQDGSGWQWMAMDGRGGKRVWTEDLEFKLFEPSENTQRSGSPGSQGSSCFSRTSSRALSRKSTRRTANFWMWEPQTQSGHRPCRPQAAGLQFHTFSMTGVAKPSGWIRRRQVQGAANLTCQWILLLRLAKCCRLCACWYTSIVVPWLGTLFHLCGCASCWKPMKSSFFNFAVLRSDSIQLQSYHVTMLRKLWKNRGHGSQWGSFRDPLV